MRRKLIVVVATLFSTMALLSGFTTASAGPSIAGATSLQCMVETPAWDEMTSGYCSGYGTGSATTAYFQPDHVDPGRYQYQWRNSSTWQLIPGCTSYGCTRTIHAGITLYVSVIIYDTWTGQSQQFDVYAIFENGA